MLNCAQSIYMLTDTMMFCVCASVWDYVASLNIPELADRLPHPAQMVRFYYQITIIYKLIR